MLHICSGELSDLDMKFNLAKCHVMRIVSRSKCNCNCLTVNNVELSFVESLTYHGTVICTGRHWRIDVAMSCRKFFHAFNNAY